MKRFLLTVLAAATLSLALPAHAGIDGALAAYLGRNYAFALKEWRPRAEQGDTVAQNNLGMMYEHGQGVPEDKVLAYALYNLSAAIDPDETNKANRDRIAGDLSRDELIEGLALTQALMQPGNFAKALDDRMENRTKKSGKAANR